MNIKYHPKLLGQTLTFGHFKVDIQELEQVSENILKRKLKIINTITGQGRIVTQIHLFDGWNMYSKVGNFCFSKFH